MPALPRLVSVVPSLLGQEKLDLNLDEELRSYLALRVDELTASGLTPDQAQRQARLELSVEQVKEQVRENRRGAGLDTLARDARVGLRLLARNPGFTIIAILTLALGIGATTAAFSTINAALLRRLPFADPGRLVIGQKTVGDRLARWVSRVDYYDFRDSAHSFDGLAAMLDGAAPVVVTGREDPWLANAGFVTSNLFPMLGVAPELGRGFLEDEETRGGATVVVISDALWRTRFGGSPSVLGTALNLNGSPHTIVGVMPPAFRFLVNADLWMLVDRNGPFDPGRTLLTLASTPTVF